MMKKKRKNLITGALPLVLLYCSLLCSCVAEDLSDCRRQKLRVTLNLETETQGTPARAGETHAVTLYAYGENGQCQLVQDFQVGDLNSTTTLEVDLAPGMYDFVAWVNHSGESFELPHYEQFPQVRPTKDVSVLYLKIPASNVIDHELPRLLHGSVSGKRLQDSDEEVSIPLVQNTNYIHFTVEGLERTTDVYEFKVRDFNGAYTFDNEFTACAPFSYVSTARFAGSGKTLESDMTVLRLEKGRSPEFLLRDRDTGKTLYPASDTHETNLVKLIERAYESQGKTIDFSRQHVFDIRMKFNGGVDMDVSITINGWEITEDDSGLRP